MDLTPYIDNLRRELAVAAEAGGQDARALAERLSAPLESAARLALLEALSAAADEITRDLAPGSVDVRLRGRDPSFVVTPPPATSSYESRAETKIAPPLPPESDDGGTSRVSLRVPDHLKPRIDEAASKEGLSVNAWLVRAVSAALEPARRTSRDDGMREETHSGRSYSGWVR
jgi:uncharacterized protein (DUF1778 family)